MLLGSFWTKHPAMLSCKISLTPHLFLCVLMGVSQISFLTRRWCFIRILLHHNYCFLDFYEEYKHFTGGTTEEWRSSVASWRCAIMGHGGSAGDKLSFIISSDRSSRSLSVISMYSSLSLHLMLSSSCLQALISSQSSSYSLCNSFYILIGSVHSEGGWPGLHQNRGCKTCGS